jgi:hypothetical protein
MMWAVHHRDQWHDLDLLEEPTAGRRLDVGGFILADSFDTLLRRISVEYLGQAWSRLSGVLKKYRLQPDDLSWGSLHPGETSVPGLMEAPSNFTGWTSLRLQHFFDEAYYAELDNELGHGTPSLRCATTWRSLKWRIAPDAYPIAMRLIEALWTDEYSEWAPAHVLHASHQPNGPYIAIARAILGDDQQQLDRAVEDAHAQYSPVGYRIVIRGYRAYIQVSSGNGAVRLPEVV